jgi:hypothetical protein
MAQASVEFTTSGNTLTVQTNHCNGTPRLSPDPGITPTETTSGSMHTFTFVGLPPGTFTVTVTCGKTDHTSSVTIP